MQSSRHLVLKAHTTLQLQKVLLLIAQPVLQECRVLFSRNAQLHQDYLVFQATIAQRELFIRIRTLALLEHIPTILRSPQLLNAHNVLLDMLVLLERTRLQMSCRNVRLATIVSLVRQQLQQHHVQLDSTQTKLVQHLVQFVIHAQLDIIVLQVPLLIPIKYVVLVTTVLKRVLLQLCTVAQLATT